jgi:cell division protein FtsN
MDGESSFRGQGFTLVVFGGLVALCSVFFILGMVVGRGQSVASAPGGETLTGAEPGPEESVERSPDLDFYEAVTEDPRPSAPTPPPSPAPARTEPLPAAPAAGGVALMLQLGAFRAEGPALSLAAEVRQKGFSAIVLRPAGGESSEFYRVQVGPFTTTDQADRVRSQLQTAGYEVMTVR